LESRTGEIKVSDPTKVHAFVYHEGPSPFCDWRILVPKGRRAVFYCEATLVLGMVTGDRLKNRPNAIRLFEFIGNGADLTARMTSVLHDNDHALLVNFALVKEQFGRWSVLKSHSLELDAQRYSFLIGSTNARVLHENVHFEYAPTNRRSYALSDKAAQSLLLANVGCFEREPETGNLKVIDGILFWVEVE